MILDKLKSKIKTHIKSLLHEEVKSALDEHLPILTQMIAYHLSPEESKHSYYDGAKNARNNISFFQGLRDRISKTGIEVQDEEIDIEDFESWLGEFPEIREIYSDLGEYHIEKCLEHYLCYRFLKLSKDDVFIDIAAAGSPFADLLIAKGIQSYRLDLCYPKGINGINIGVDAGDTGLEDGFASALSLQCAYECFMGEDDIRFVEEAARITNDKGRYSIVPLYLADTYFNSTSPQLDQRELTFDSKAKKVWRDDKFLVPFDRHYSPEAFKERVYDHLPENMEGKVFFFSNLDELMDHYQGQLIYCFFLFLCWKK